MMSGAELVFVVFAAMAAVGFATTLRSRKGPRRTGGLALFFLALSGLHVLLAAPIVALVQVIAGAGVIALLAAGSPADGSNEPPRSRRDAALAGLGVVGLGFVLVGTMARQYVSFGADLDAQPEFGSAPALGAELFGRHALSVDVLGLVLLVAVVAVTSAARSSWGDRGRTPP